MSEVIIINILVEDSIYGLEGPQVALFGDLKVFEEALALLCTTLFAKGVAQQLPWLDYSYTEVFVYELVIFEEKNPVYQVI